jgi:hypothetical protein
MQTDKQLYLSGELLWLKLSTTDSRGRLMDCSKIGYVELIHGAVPEVQIKVDIRDGVGAGWMELPVTLPTGYYRMIAYTRFMRNEGEDVFFEKMIAIVNPFHQSYELYDDETNHSFSYQPIDNNNAALDLSLDRPAYASRSKGEISIKGLPAENISLCISVAGVEPALEETVTVDEWTKQLPAKSASVADRRYLPEYEGPIIDGVLIDLETGNPASGAQAVTLLSFPGNEIQLFAGQTSSGGDVTFYAQCVTGKQELTTTAIAPQGKKYRVDILPPYALHTPVDLPVFKPDSTWNDYLRARYLSVQVAHIYTADSLSIIQEIPLCSNLRPQTWYVLDDYTRFTTMSEIFTEFISNARIRRTNEGSLFSMINTGTTNYSTNILVLLDNIPVADHELMVNYNPLLVKTIDLYFGQYFFGRHSFDGIISFHTYKNDYPGIKFSENTQIFDYEGAQPYRYHYTPRYDETSISTPLPDFRHTLLWEPLLQSKGRSELKIPFTTSDMPGSYVVTIEGIGENGTVVYAEQTFDVGVSNEILYKPGTKALGQSENVVTDTSNSLVLVQTDVNFSNVKVIPSTPVSAAETVDATPVEKQEPVSSSTTIVSAPVKLSQTTPPPATTDDVLAKVKIQPGQRLTLLALEYYGNKVFWVYIYEYNKARIGPNPNRILPGMELLIPAKTTYDIDANSNASIDKATEIQRQIL